MKGTKLIDKITIFLIISALVFSFVLIYFPGKIVPSSVDIDNQDYLKLFEQDITTIDISVEESEWNKMLDNKMSKPYISCNLKINGHKFNNVGIRPKGNSSLTSSQGARISFRLDFDHYIDNQTCFGLEQIVLNNLQADATYMKDYIAYELMSYEGVNAPVHTYANITLNGEPFGVYLAVEVYEDEYLERIYKDTDARLYSVKSSGLNAFENGIVDADSGTVIKRTGVVKATAMQGPGGPPPMDGEGFPPNGMMPPPDDGFKNNFATKNDGNTLDIGRMFGDWPSPPGGANGGGGDLVYTDNVIESYNTIFGNAVSEYASAEDFAKVIKAIKVLNKKDVSKEELELYWDVDSILRYMAVHTFMVNGDSYTGNMKQNYYLVEREGRLSILPWDYNLSFGSFGGGPGGPGGPPSRMGNTGNSKPNSRMDETTEVINHAIDTPVIGVDMESRPLVSVLLSDQEYKDKYHQYLNHLTKYTSEEFINHLEIVENAIYQYIKLEKVSFYTPTEHTNAFSVLKEFLKLRSESVQKQLAGIIPSETELQKNAALITADLSLDDMGNMGGPPGGPAGPGDDTTSKNMMPPQPPGIPGMETYNSIEDALIVFIISLMMLGLAFVEVKLFKRNY